MRRDVEVSGRPVPGSPGRRLTFAAIAAAALLGLGASIAPACAQDTLVFGRNKDVVVNLDALDELGPPPLGSRARPGELGPSSSGPIVLKPPHRARRSHERAAAKPHRQTAHAGETHKPKRTAEAEKPKAPAARQPRHRTESAEAETKPKAKAERKSAQAEAENPVAAPAPSAPTRTAKAETGTTMAAGSPPPPPSPSIMESPPPPPPKAPGGPTENPVGDLLPQTGKAAKAAPEKQLAEKPPEPGPPAISEGRGSKAFSINFAANSSDLPDSAKSRLDDLAATLAKNDNERLQLIAYAAGPPNQESETRRLSFSRALVVRAYLVQKGVSGTRMDVRALGNKVEGGGPADRVDLVLVNQ